MVSETQKIRTLYFYNGKLWPRLFDRGRYRLVEVYRSDNPNDSGSFFGSLYATVADLELAVSIQDFLRKQKGIETYIIYRDWSNGLFLGEHRPENRIRNVADLLKNQGKKKEEENSKSENLHFLIESI